MTEKEIKSFLKRIQKEHPGYTRERFNIEVELEARRIMNEIKKEKAKRLKEKYDK
jgi:hypothetical protein